MPRIIAAILLSSLLALACARAVDRATIQTVDESLAQSEFAISQVEGGTHDQAEGLRALLLRYQSAEQVLRQAEEHNKTSATASAAASQKYRRAEHDYKLSALVLIELHTRQTANRSVGDECSDLEKFGGDLLRAINAVGDGPIEWILRGYFGNRRVNKILKSPLAKAANAAEEIYKIFVDC
jgi:hypothetical protein